VEGTGRGVGWILNTPLSSSLALVAEPFLCPSSAGTCTALRKHALLSLVLPFSAPPLRPLRQLFAASRSRTSTVQGSQPPPPNRPSNHISERLATPTTPAPVARTAAFCVIRLQLSPVHQFNNKSASRRNNTPPRGRATGFKHDGEGLRAPATRW
jgi:hypothetical protein